MVSIILVVLGVVMALALCHKEEKTYEEKVAVFAEENAKFSKNQIVFLGDSITEKYNLNRNYRDLDLDCYNRGISGDTTTWLLSRLQVSIFDISPAIIVLMIGTNDINNGRTPEEISNTYNTILQLISTNLPDTLVYCMSIIPQNNEHSNNASHNNVTIMETNAQIEVLAEDYGYEYINLYDRLLDEDEMLQDRYTNDGLHLNKRGYKVWTDIMKRILN